MEINHFNGDGWITVSVERTALQLVALRAAQIMRETGCDSTEAVRVACYEYDHNLLSDQK